MNKIDLFDNSQVLFADVPTPILLVSKSMDANLVQQRVASIKHFWRRTLYSPRVRVEASDQKLRKVPSLPTFDALDHAFSWYSHFGVSVDEAIEDIRNVLLSGTCRARAEYERAVDECINQYLR